MYYNLFKLFDVRIDSCHTCHLRTYRIYSAKGTTWSVRDRRCRCDGQRSLPVSPGVAPLSVEQRHFELVRKTASISPKAL